MKSVPKVTLDELKKLIIDELALEGMEPGEIGDDEPLFGDGIGLDSVDALELVVALEKRYRIRIDGQQIDPEDFASVAAIAEMVGNLLAEQRAAARPEESAAS